MVYRVIGIMSGSSLDGLDIAFIELQQTRGQWNYEMLHGDCIPYSDEWKEKLSSAHRLPALEYQLLHVEYGHFIGKKVNEFINKHQLEYKVQLIASHGHTVFHAPSKLMTAQLGDGAAIAAETSINVVSDLRSMDVALGGHGAPIVPVGEQRLLSDYTFFLNLGGIANLSYNRPDGYIAFDVCPANRVLNMLVRKEGKAYDENGAMASTGKVHEDLLQTLNQLEYYSLPYPKSLSNAFGTDTVYPILDNSAPTADLLRTYVEHIAMQVKRSLEPLLIDGVQKLRGDAESKLPVDGGSQLPGNENAKLLVTGGGAHNHFLVERIKQQLSVLPVEVVVPSPELVDYKEAIIMGFIGLLRWREEANVFASVTGASRNSIGGAVWLG